jgi:hypothetical protein
MPLGGVRTYANIGDRELTFGSWGEAVKQGRTLTTSGPLIELDVDGHAPGDELTLGSGGASVAVVATARSPQPIDSLELVWNGLVVASEQPKEGSREMRLATTVRLEGPGWFAARCQGPSMLWHDRPVRTAAHTSPIYVVGPGSPVDASADRAFLVTVLDAGLVWLDRLATRADESRHSRIRQVFVDARDQLVSP